MTRDYWANLALCIVLGALVIFAISQASSALTPKGLFVGDHEPSPEARGIMQEVVLEKFKLVENSNKMVEAEFVIQNKSAHSIKNIEIQCEFFDSNGRYVDQETWLLAQTVPSMHVLESSPVSKRFVNTATQAFKCYLGDFQVVKQPAFTLDRHVSSGHGQSSGSGHGEEAPAGH